VNRPSRFLPNLALFALFIASLRRIKRTDRTETTGLLVGPVSLSSSPAPVAVNGHHVSRGPSRVVPDLALLVLAAAAALVVAADLQPVRPFVVFAAACLVPGGAILTRLRTGEPLTEVALTFGLSFAVEIAGSLVLTWSGWWHPEALWIALGIGSVGLLVSDLVRVSR